MERPNSPPKPPSGPSDPRAGAHELPADFVAKVDELYARLDATDYYALLGVPRNAKRAQVRSAFTKAAAQFHPDRFFGKRLGEVGPRMQRIFARLSLAHDTLLDDERRAAYDADLPAAPEPPIAAPEPTPEAVVTAVGRAPTGDAAATNATAAMGATGAAAVTGGAPGPMRSAAATTSGAPAPMRSAAATVGAASGSAPSGGARVEAAAPSVPATAAPAATTSPGPVRRDSGSIRVSADAERARREAFAARLSGRPSSAHMRAVSAAAPSPPASVPAPAARQPSSPDHARAATEALRRRYEEQRARVETHQVTAYTRAAESAVARGDFAAAAQAYEAALQHTSDPTLRAAHAEAAAKAKRQALEAALKRARDAEEAQNWPDAAAAYARAFDLAPDADVAHRASTAFRRAGNDPRRATQYGEQAVKLDPNRAQYRLALALAYVDAGLLLRARGELDRAQQIDPKHPMIKEVSVRLKGR